MIGALTQADENTAYIVLVFLILGFLFSYGLSRLGKEWDDDRDGDNDDS